MGKVYDAIINAVQFIKDNLLISAICGGVLVLLIILLIVLGAKRKAKKRAASQRLAVPVEVETAKSEPVGKPVVVAEESKPVVVVEESKPIVEAEAPVEKPTKKPVAKKPVAKKPQKAEPTDDEFAPKTKPIVVEEAKLGESETEIRVEAPIEEAPKASVEEMPEATADAPVVDVAPKKAAPKKAPAKKSEPKVTKVEEDPEIHSRYAGKWIVEKKADKEYIFTLYASNGELLCESESYTTAQGAKKGIETFKRNLDLGSMRLDEDKRGRFRFKIYGTNDKLLFVGENYDTKERAQSSYNSVKRFAKTAHVVDATKTESVDK